MKVVYHPRLAEVYASDPAAMPGRMEAIVEELRGFDFIQPEPAQVDDLRLVHSQGHIDSIKRDARLYEVAALAVGGAIRASELAMAGSPAFGLIRPPGHHASSDSCWGFCFFNNIAIALARLQAAGRIRRAFVLDFDLHYGDGTADILSGPRFAYFHPQAHRREEFVDIIERRLAAEGGYDIIAVSAGFDRHEQDWGRMLHTEDYQTIGRLVKEAAARVCQGRRFAVLEGGYNHAVLGQNVKAFVQGLA
ncbi:MAG TPA: histone deacetylase family protein [Dehalococcoidia bacterium]|jgi:acetoin utilization deacetylase AcuC-like enzyme|nr:histone deacetylase family protein [Dehalococcoidia bacterium]